MTNWRVAMSPPPGRDWGFSLTLSYADIYCSLNLFSLLLVVFCSL